jgi:hypothetical protein
MLSYALPIGIKKVEKNNSIGLTPAKCFRDTGLVLINNYFLRLPEDAQYFVLCHEAGHILLDTDNEFEADNAGFNLYVKSGRSLKGAVKALSQTLPFGSKNVNEQLQAQWLQRLQAQLNRAIEFDNKNNNLKPYKMRLLNKLKPKLEEIEETDNNNLEEENEDDSYGELSKSSPSSQTSSSDSDKEMDSKLMDDGDISE